MLTKLALVIVCSLGVAGCTPYGVAVATPAIGGQWVAPGVQVVDGWQDPVFFADNGYWWWSDNGWMSWDGRGWMWGQPPVVLSTGIRDPWRYRGWNGGRGGQPIVRDHRGGGPIVRDHRTTAGWSRPTVQRAPGNWSRPVGGGGMRGGAVIRDHRRR